MRLSDLFYNRRMICSRCKGYMVKEPNYDLPGGYHEFYCLNCGKRIWLSEEMLKRPVFLN
ncbi:MAG: hypothetical protein LWY06_11850 [Firmicutes bacterium]|nr:hypothetical protein [Bacillota bacterium]